MRAAARSCDAHRLERAGADVQREVRERDAAPLQRVEQRRVEMQPGGRRGDRARLARIDRLVALRVALVRGARHVQRQRHRRRGARAARTRRRSPRSAGGRARRCARARSPRSPSARTSVAPGARRMVHAHLREDLVRPEHALDHDLDAAARLLAPDEPRLDHARVVQHDDVAARDEAGDVAELPVGAARRSRRRDAAAGSRRARPAETARSAPAAARSRNRRGACRDYRRRGYGA